MSFFDFRFRKGAAPTWEGMKPPRLLSTSLLSDLVWHNTLYKMNELQFPLRIAFLSLRVVQLTAYYVGWKAGEKDEH